MYGIIIRFLTARRCILMVLRAKQVLVAQKLSGDLFMDEKTKKTVFAIITAILSIIASTLGCVFGTQTSTPDDSAITSSFVQME